jgi:hypothetical protein
MIVRSKTACQRRLEDQGREQGCDGGERGGQRYGGLLRWPNVFARRANAGGSGGGSRRASSGDAGGERGVEGDWEILASVKAALEKQFL